MGSIVRLFRRETLSTDFIPVIDGLRFLAILMVVLFHINVFVEEKSAGMSFSPATYFPWANVMTVGHLGVKLFFVISGFVLALPFMRDGLGLTEKPVSLRSFFLRRLTRLEPPYIICIVVLFVLRAFVISDRFTLGDLVLSLFSSVFYLSNFVFPGELPHINDVTWSLEIEVQFYILAPLLTGALCLIKDKIRRRIVTLLLIAGGTALGWLLSDVLHTNVESLARYLQYFLSGVLLCDIFLLDSGWLGKIDNVTGLILGAILFVLVVSFDHAGSPNPLVRLLSPLMILAFYLIVFGNRWWNRVFSMNGLTLIGGMCYSIYLLHWVVIASLGRVTITRLAVSNYYAFFVIQAFVYLFAIIVISGAYFLLIEKPCMKRDWYINLYRWLKNITFRRKYTTLKNTI